MSIKQKEIKVPTVLDTIKFGLVVSFAFIAVLVPIFYSYILGVATNQLGIENVLTWYYTNDVALNWFFLTGAFEFTVCNTATISIFLIFLIQLYERVLKNKN